MGVYDRQIANALRVIAKKGESVQWKRSLPPVETDPAKPWDVAAAAADIRDVIIVFLPRDRVNTQSARNGAEPEIKIGNVYGLMGQVNFSVSPDDVIIRGDKELRINAIDTLAPNGEEILHTIDFDL